MKQVKRALSIVLVVIMMIMPIQLQVSATSRTAEEAINWVKSKLGQGLDMDGAYGAQCVDLILAYYDYLGVSRSSGNGADYAWNTLPSGWQRIQGAQPQKGDILVYSGNASNSYGHVAIYESDRSHYHQNFNSHPYVEQVTYMYNGLSNPYWGVIRPNWNTTPSNPFTGTYAEEITGTNAKLRASLNLTYVSQCGLYFGTSVSNMTKRNTEDVYAKINNIHYYMNGDFAIGLKHQTTYYYKFYVIIDGVEIQSATSSFNAGGAHSWNAGTVTKAATCISTGSKVCSCYCGATKTETIPVNASNHVNTKTVSATVSTCTVNGYSAGVYCNDCKQYISGHAKLPLANHSAPDANGNCTVCGQHIKDVTPEQQGDACPWCGGSHSGFFGGIVGFFHRIFAAIFGARH